MDHKNHKNCRLTWEIKFQSATDKEREPLLFWRGEFTVLYPWLFSQDSVNRADSEHSEAPWGLLCGDSHKVQLTYALTKIRESFLPDGTVALELGVVVQSEVTSLEGTSARSPHPARISHVGSLNKLTHFLWSCDYRFRASGRPTLSWRSAGLGMVTGMIRLVHF